MTGKDSVTGKDWLRFMLIIPSLGCSMCGPQARRSGGPQQCVVNMLANVNLMRALRGLAPLNETGEGLVEGMQGFGSRASTKKVQDAITERTTVGWCKLTSSRPHLLSPPPSPVCPPRLPRHLAS